MHTVVLVRERLKAYVVYVVLGWGLRMSHQGAAN